MRAGLFAAVLLAMQVSALETGYRWDLPKGFPTPRVPADNPMSEAKVRLGRYLFYDTRLSGNRTQSCASCHKQEFAFTDGRSTGLGSTGKNHSRGAMSLVNIAYSAAFTWSNPTLRSLEEQALVPLLGKNPVELGFDPSVLSEFRADPIYGSVFPAVFPNAKDPFTLANIAKSLAAFERSIISARSPYDRYYRGGDLSAISESAKRGEGLFFTDYLAGCYRCHGGFNFSDASESEANRLTRVEFHNTGLYFAYPAPNVGIYEYTKHPAPFGKFKTPTVRNVSLTAPYMHDGSIATLEEVLDHYAEGGRTISAGPNAGRGRDNPHKDARMSGIPLTRQNRVDLIEFLLSLTDNELIHDPRFANPWRP